MNDSADIKRTQLADAAKALQQALRSLETSVDPLLARLDKLETKAKEAEGFSEDRARLASELDAALEARQARESEFESLSKRTRQELDLTINALKQTLSDSAQHGDA